QPTSVVVGDFNGDGFPDLALTNKVIPGAVTVLLNAADWGGGAAALPPGGPGLQPGPGTLPAELGLSLWTTYQPRPAFLTAIAFRPIPVQSWPAEIRSGNSLLAEATLPGMF